MKTESNRTRDDDLIELVPVPNESLPDPEQVADRRKTQTTIIYKLLQNEDRMKNKINQPMLYWSITMYKYQ